MEVKAGDKVRIRWCGGEFDVTIVEDRGGNFRGYVYLAKTDDAEIGEILSSHIIGTATGEPYKSAN